MELLADENVKPEWLQALLDDGHDVTRVVDLSDLGPSAVDRDILALARTRDLVLLTADQTDFGDPWTDDHAGVIVVTDLTRSGGELRRAVRRLDDAVPDLSGQVAYAGDWL